MRTRVLLLAAAAVGVSANIFNVTLPPCTPSGYGAAVIGQPAAICITINGGSRALFTPKADSFSAIRLSGCET